MPESFAPLFRLHLDTLTRAWVDEIYADRRTELPAMLSYRELVGHLPELFEELTHVLDTRAPYAEIVEAIRRLRFHAQVRFQQGCLIDEVARELMILRDVLNDFLWREGVGGADGDLWELREAFRRTNAFMDELIAQAVLIYAATLRPNIKTRTSTWPPPRRRKTDFPGRDEQK